MQALKGSEGAKTVRLRGFIESAEVLMLLDSGSSHCFINEHIAISIPGWQQLQAHVHVKVANGSEILYTHELHNLVWGTQGHTFKTTFKIIPLGSYDIILGMDWLESHSPMHIDCKQKWLSFPHEGRTVKLQGILPDTIVGHPISTIQLLAMEKQDSILYTVQVCSIDSATLADQDWPPEIKELISQYSSIFEEPTGLPPARSGDHQIPLIPGAQPFRLRSYHYNPAQKEEIEKQIHEMLHKGWIQFSSSPFSSPILLVKKKTGDWRLCVDFRHLNALTIKNKYPLPIIDEILDELFGASWFTSLDLSSGFHQIRLKSGEEFKTAFQTHHSHHEYKVMPYGVTGGPATFQGIMNVILAPLLRKCVVVFIDDILIYSSTYTEHISHVQQVFEILQQHKFFVKLSKCMHNKS